MTTAKARQAAVKDETPSAEGKTDAKAEAKAEAADWKTAVTDCAVDDGTPHTGRAVPGTRICSRHALHYKNDGSRR